MAARPRGRRRRQRPDVHHVLPADRRAADARHGDRPLPQVAGLANPVLERPFPLRDGHLAVPEKPGLGIEWDEKSLASVAP